MPKPGDTVTLTGALINTGNVTLTDVQASIADRDDITVETPTGSIAPGKSADVSIASSVLTQEDVDKGSITFRFLSGASGPKEQTVTAEESADVTIEQAPLVESELSAHLAETEHGAPRVGDEIALAAMVRNTGNVTLTDVAAGTGHVDPVQVENGTLAPGAEVAVELAPYAITQEDIDRGSVAFDLTTAGATPTGDSVSSGDHRDVSLESSAAIDISGDYTVSGATDALRPGYVVTGTFTIANTGNRTLDRTEFEQNIGEAVDCATSELQPGRVVRCETKYTVTEADARNGSVTLTAKVKGQYLAAGVPAEGATARAATVQKPVWVFSKEITKKFSAEPAPQELAFTGTEVVMIGVPIAIVALLLGLVLLLAARRRRRSETGPTQD